MRLVIGVLKNRAEPMTIAQIGNPGQGAGDDVPAWDPTGPQSKPFQARQRLHRIGHAGSGHDRAAGNAALQRLAQIGIGSVFQIPAAGILAPRAETRGHAFRRHAGHGLDRDAQTAFCQRRVGVQVSRERSRLT